MDIALITGSTDGIGKQAALKLASIGTNVIVHGRNNEKVEQTVLEIKDRSKNNNIFGVVSDFTDLHQVKELSNKILDRFSNLNILVNNACVFSHDKIITEDGYEVGFQVCYLAHFVLTFNLLQMLKKNKRSVIINVSSMVHSSSLDINNLNSEKFYNGYGAYSNVKLLNILFTYKLKRVINGNNPRVYAVHPGVISTKLLHKGWGYGGASVEVGASNILSPILNNTLKNYNGVYIENQKVCKSAQIAYDKGLQDKLWNKSIGYIQKFLL